MDALHKLQDGNLALETPQDPRTGVTRLSLDPLEWIHRISAHIPDPGRHGQRCYGACSNRARARISSAVGDRRRFRGRQTPGEFRLLQGSPEHVGAPAEENL
jgi:hypothetical protein